MFIETIDKMRKKLEIEKVIFARDCPRSDIWRLLFFPAYKTGRSSHKNIGSIFKKSYNDIICKIVDDNKYCDTNFGEGNVIYDKFREIFLDSQYYPDVTRKLCKKMQDIQSQIIMGQ